MKQGLILTGFWPFTLAKSPLAAFHAAYQKRRGIYEFICAAPRAARGIVMRKKAFAVIIAFLIVSALLASCSASGDLTGLVHESMKPPNMFNVGFSLGSSSGNAVIETGDAFVFTVNSANELFSLKKTVKDGIMTTDFQGIHVEAPLGEDDIFFYLAEIFAALPEIDCSRPARTEDSGEAVFIFDGAHGYKIEFTVSKPAGRPVSVAADTPAGHIAVYFQ